MKSITITAFVVAATVSAAAVLGTPPAAAQQTTMRIGNVTARDTQAALNDMLGALSTKYSNGRIKSSVSHGGALGNSLQMLAAMQAGGLQAMISPSFIMSGIVPEVSVLDMPFAIEKVEPKQITAFIRQSQAAKRIRELAEAKGLHILGMSGVGPQNFLTSFKITKASDFKGRKFAVNYSPPRIGMIKDWGGVSRNMGLGQWYTSIQQHLIDGFDMPPDVLYRMKFFEVAKYYTITDHVVLVETIYTSKKWFDGLPKDLQEAVNKAAHDTIGAADDLFTKSQAGGLAALKKAITVTKMPPAELAKLKAMVEKGTWERMARDPKLGPLVKLLKGDIARFNKS
jgi:TRAP-type C4-dicarboxylate transport system substrate-binding protein